MKHYRNAYTTLDDVTRQFLIDNAALEHASNVDALITLAQTNTVTYLKRLLFDVSSTIHNYLGRTFVPYQETVSYYSNYTNTEFWYDKKAQAYKLNLDEDCLSVTSVAVDDVALTASSGYRLANLNRTPNDVLILASVPTLSTFESSIDITALWGYHENYSNAWSSIGTLQADISSTSATTFVATAGTVALFETYAYLKIDSEFMFVTSVLTTAPYTITVERGVNGTTAATHSSGTTVSAYQQMANVAQETRRLVIRAYSLRDASNNVYVSGEEIRELVETEFSLNINGRVVFGGA